MKAPRAKAAPKAKTEPKTEAKTAAHAPEGRRAAPALDDESDEEQMSKGDLETAILEFLVSRKTQQQTRRRQLWSQLAGL